MVSRAHRVLQSLGLLVAGGVLVAAGRSVLAPAAMLAASGAAIAAPSEPGTIVDVASSAGQFKTLLAAAKAAGLVDALNGPGPLTVFAPNDAAFAALPAGTVEKLLRPENKEMLAEILKYHVTAGKVESSTKTAFVPTLAGQRAALERTNGTLTIAGANIIATDIRASNGVIHVLDKVLMPAGDDVIVTAGKAKLNTLAAAINAAGLADALKGLKNATIFAPTDEAFAKLPEGLVAALLKPENKDALAAVLKHHVVAESRVYADRATANPAMLRTLGGQTLAVALVGGTVKINESAGVVKADVETSNGVVHVIDAVLVPAGLDVKKLLTMDGGMTPGSMPGSMRGSPRDVLAMAIDKGAPFYNGGKPEACCAVYEVAIAGVLAMDKGEGVCETVRGTFRAAVQKGKTQHDLSERAWTYRDAMDKALAMMPTGK